MFIILNYFIDFDNIYLSIYISLFYSGRFGILTTQRIPRYSDIRSIHIQFRFETQLNTIQYERFSNLCDAWKKGRNEARCAVKFRRHLATNVAKGKSLRKVARVIPSLFRMRNVPGMGRLCVRCTFMICSQREFLNSIELTICVGVLDDDDDDLKIWWLDKINA